MFLAQTQIADNIQQHYCSVIAQNHFEFSKQSSSQQARKQRKRSRKWTQPRMTSKTSPSSFKTSSKKCRAGTSKFTSSIIFDFKRKLWFWYILSVKINHIYKIVTSNLHWCGIIVSKNVRRFQHMSDAIIGRIDDMGTRIDDLEKYFNF